MIRQNAQLSRLGKSATLLLLAAACFGMDRLHSADDAKTPAAQNRPTADAQGDPLPAGALLRLGTLRWRHGDVITYVAFTPDGKTVLTAGRDNTIRLWERETGKEIRRFTSTGDQNNVPPAGRAGVMFINGAASRGQSALALSPDGKTLATVQGNNMIQLWEVSSGKKLREFKGSNNGAASLLFSPDSAILAVRGGDRTVYLLATETGNEIRQIKIKQPAAAGGRIIAIGGGSGQASGMAFSPDGKTLATSEYEIANQKIDTYVRLAEVETGKEIRRIDTAPNGVSAVAYSPDGKILAHGGGNSVYFRAADGVKEIRQINSPAAVSALAFAPDGKSLAVKGRDQAIRIYTTASGEELRQLGDVAPVAGGANLAIFGFGAAGDAQDMAFAPDSQVLAAGGAHAVRMWQVASGKEQALTGGHRGAVSAVLAAPDGKTLLSRGADGVIRRWDAVSGQELGQFKEPQGTVAAIFSPDGRTAGLVNSDITIRLHDVVSGKELHQLKGHPNGVSSVAFSPDGKTLASRGVDGIRLHDVVRGGEIRMITLQTGMVGNPGGAIVFSSGSAAGAGSGLAFSPDNRTVAAVVTNNTAPVIVNGRVTPAVSTSSLRLWDVATGKETRQIPLPPQPIVTGIAFSPDGRVLATDRADQTISLWEIASGKERVQLGKPAANTPNNAQTGWVVVGGFGGIGRTSVASSTLAYTPDGALLASKGPGNAVRIWDVDASTEIGQFKGHEGAIAAISFGPDGKTLASGSSDTTVLVWDVAGLKREPKISVADLQPKELDVLWADLVGGDARKAFSSILSLAASNQAAAFLGERLKPAAPVDPKVLEQLVADLDSVKFPVRKKATDELEKLGDLAMPALQKVLTSQPTLEARMRVEPLIEKLTTGVLGDEQVRLVRAVEVLERLGSADARQLLTSLAKGAPGALPTRQAEAALERLTKKQR